MHILYSLPFGTGTILCVPILKDLPPTQLCKQCRCTVDLVRLEATLQLSSIYKSCLIYWVGGRDSSLQKLVAATFFQL